MKCVKKFGILKMNRNRISKLTNFSIRNKINNQIFFDLLNEFHVINKFKDFFFLGVNQPLEEVLEQIIRDFNNSIVARKIRKKYL